MATVDFVPFATGGGANVESQATYILDPQTAIGQQPGIAKSAQNNKALRQGTSMASALAQFLSQVTGDNLIDDGVLANIIATMGKAFKTAPTVQRFLTGSGTYTLPANVLYIRVRAVGGGGGGAGSGTLGSGGNGANGTDTTFGTALLSAGFGTGAIGGVGQSGGAGGTTSLGVGPVGLSINGGSGITTSTFTGLSDAAGGQGGSSALGGAGLAGATNTAGGAGVTNSGGGGGGAGESTLVASVFSGSGGGSGGFLDAIIHTPAATYLYSVGTGGLGGTAGTSGTAGGDGGSGVIIVEEYYQ